MKQLTHAGGDDGHASRRPIAVTTANIAGRESWNRLR
jgi:hypothetical protein